MVRNSIIARVTNNNKSQKYTVNVIEWRLTIVAVIISTFLTFLYILGIVPLHGWIEYIIVITLSVPVIIPILYMFPFLLIYLLLDYPIILIIVAYLKYLNI